MASRYEPITAKVIRAPMCVRMCDARQRAPSGEHCEVTATFPCLFYNFNQPESLSWAFATASRWNCQRVRREPFEYLNANRLPISLIDCSDVQRSPFESRRKNDVGRKSGINAMRLSRLLNEKTGDVRSCDFPLRLNFPFKSFSRARWKMCEKVKRKIYFHFDKCLC